MKKKEKLVKRSMNDDIGHEINNFDCLFEFFLSIYPQICPRKKKRRNFMQEFVHGNNRSDEAMTYQIEISLE